MASHLFNLCLLLSVMGLISSGAIAQSTSAISSCASAIMGLSPCASNSTRGSSRPTSACCSALASAVQDSPDCLCSVLSNGAGSALGMVIPLAFPKACSIPSSALTQCSASPPAGSTTTSSIAPSTTPLADSPTSDVGSEAPSSDVPTDSGSSTVNNLPAFQGFSGGSITKSSLHFVALVASVVSWTLADALY